MERGSLGSAQSGEGESISEAITNAGVGRMMAALDGYVKTGKSRHPRGDGKQEVRFG